MNDNVKLLKAEIKRLRKKVSELSPSLETILKNRGFSIHKKEPSEDLLIPSPRYASAFYKRMHKYSFRLFIRDVIKYQKSFTLDKVTKFSTREVSAEYLDFILRAGIAERHGRCFRLRKRPIKSFGETLEAFVARVIRNEFQCEAIWGVKFKRPGVGGDYDLIAKMNSSLLYMEIKSSPPKQIYDREITSFFNRVEDLAPEISIFFVDTELRMKDKIVPMFEYELRNRYNREIAVSRIVKELFHINRKIFIINAKGGISKNINIVLTYSWYKKFSLD